MILKRKLYLLVIIWCCLAHGFVTLRAREAAMFDYILRSYMLAVRSHSELLSDYDFDQFHKLAKIERLAWFYQSRVKEYGEFLPEGEQRHALENVWLIRAKAIDMYLATKKKT